MSLKIPFRYVIGLLVFMATACDYLGRNNINVGLVYMVYPPNTTERGNTSDVCPYLIVEPQTNSSTGPVNYDNRFDWDSTTQGMILGAFYFSYACLNTPFGRFSELYSSKWIIAASLIGSAVINIVTPFATTSAFTLILTRVLLGIAQSGLFPACFGLLRQWFPLKERSMAFAITTLGATAGGSAGSALAGIISDHGCWQNMFYVSGAIITVAFVIWIPLAESKPEHSRFVSPEELEYIRRSDRNEEKTIANPKVPWTSIITSGPVLALALAKCCHGFASFVLFTKLPAYLSDILHVSPTTNGLINAFPSVMMVLTTIFSGYASEVVIQKNWLSRTACRKVHFSFVTFAMASSLALVPLVGCSEAYVIAILLFCNFGIGFNAGGPDPIPSELTHHFPSTLYALLQTMATSQGLVAPYLAGVILDSRLSDNLMDLWRYVLFTAASATLIGGLVFVLFGQAKRQEWDYFEEEDETEHLCADHDDSLIEGE